MNDPLLPIAVIPALVVMYCLFVVALADDGYEPAQRWVCVFDQDRPYCAEFLSDE